MAHVRSAYTLGFITDIKLWLLLPVFLWDDGSIINYFIPRLHKPWLSHGSGENPCFVKHWPHTSGIRIINAYGHVKNPSDARFLVSCSGQNRYGFVAFTTVTH